MNRLLKIFLQPRRTLSYIGVTILQKIHRLFPDILCVKILYFLYFGKKLNLDNPQSFNEKLNWLKINDQNPLYTQLADKFAVKEYVQSLIGEEYVIKPYGVWDSYEDIDFDKLPNSFVLKTTHDSGGVYVCRDKSSCDFEKIKKFISANMSKNFYYISWEWPYKNIKPRIIADEYLNDGRAGELQDYKFWCFNGTPMYIYLTNKGDKIYENFYDMDFTPVDINHGSPRYYPEYTKPEHFEEMRELAKSLSAGIPFVRVDFFVVNNRVYFGEYTFYDWGGVRPFDNYNTDLELGKLLQLQNVYIQK